MIKFVFFCLFLNLFLLNTVGAEHLHDEYETPQVNYRQGKLFSKVFWNGFEKGIDDTMDVIARVRSNLEVALDQVTDNLGTSLFSFADRIDDTVEESLPPFLRRDQPGMDQTFEVSGVTGDIKGDVDEVYYSNNGEEEESPVDISLLEDEREVEPQTNNKNRFNIFSSPIFRPFASTRNNFFNINIFGRQSWWQGENVCVDREEIDEEEKNTNDQMESDSETTAEFVAETREAEEIAEEVTGGAGEDEVEVTEQAVTTTPTSDINSTTERVRRPFPFSFSMESSTCIDSDDKHTCITRTNRRGIHKTVKVTHRCCHGFTRNGRGCSQVTLRSMSDTLSTLVTTTDFLSLAKAANIMDQLETTNVTLFVPTNEAVEEYTLELEEQNELANNIEGKSMNNIFRRKRQVHSLTPTLLSHVVDGFMYLGDLTDELIMPTLNVDSTIRVNVYEYIRPRVVTVNCARLIKANQHSITGVVHTIDRVLTPVQKTIFEIIESDPQFSILRSLMNQAEYSELLKKDGQFTLFAPTDAAFEKLKPSILASLLEGSSCLEAVIKQHVIPHTICSAAIQDKSQTLNVLETYLVVERDAADQLTIQDAKLIETDIMGTNGVIHVIDTALMPNEAKSVGDVLKSHNLTRFIDLINAAELMDELNAHKDITVFAPSNAAFEVLSQTDLDLIQADKTSLKNLLRYHVATPSIKSRNINNNHLSETKAGYPLRINLYSTIPIFQDIFGTMGGRAPARVTAGCARVSDLDGRACGAVVHVIERMLEIPKANVLEALEDSKFSIFHQMIKDVGVDQLLMEDGPFTVLVPSDHVFRTLPQEELSEIMNDEEMKRNIVNRHIMKEHVCCSGISASSFLSDRKRTLDGETVHLRRSYSGRLMAGPARITSCGYPTNNGVLHTVNRILLAEREMSNNRQRVGGSGNRIFHLPRILDIIQF